MPGKLPQTFVALAAAISMAACGAMGGAQTTVVSPDAARAEDAARRAEIAATAALEAAQRADEAARRLQQKATTRE